MKLKILFIGRIEARKSVDELIHGVANFNKIHEIDSLTIVGSEDKEPRYARKIRKLTENILPNKVKFIGFVNTDEIFDFYSEHDITLFTTTEKSFPMTEGMPNTVLEALSNHCLVLATGVAGVPELFTGELDPFLLDPNNVSNDLVKKLTWFSGLDKKEKDEFIKIAQDKLLNYTEEVVMPKYIKQTDLLMESKKDDKKIALFCPYPYDLAKAFGGVVAVSKNLIEGFNKISKGQELIVITLSSPNDKVLLRRSQDTKVYYLPKVRLRNILIML